MQTDDERAKQDFFRERPDNIITPSNPGAEYAAVDPRALSGLDDESFENWA